MDDMLRRVPTTNSRGAASSAPPVPRNLMVEKLPVKPKTTITIRSDDDAEGLKLAAKPDPVTPPLPRPAATSATVGDIQGPDTADDPDDMAVEDDTPTPETPESPTEPPKAGHNPLRRFFGGYWHRKLWTLPLTILVLVGIIAAVPQSRYPILALFLKRPFSITVVDSKTNTPVSGASVQLDGMSATTNTAGKVSFTAKVGTGSLSVNKKYYQSATQSIFVGIMTAHNNLNLALVATGRQVPIKVVDKISGLPVPNASVKVLDTNATTDASGTVMMVLPTTAPTQAVTVSADGYTALSSNVQITSDVVAANTFTLVPAGRIYFLSNLSGKIDVVSTNLDGTDRTTVLAGTGSEDATNTVLLASRDWQFLALLSKRDGGDTAKLFLVNTSNNQVTPMDTTAATFTPVGWSGHMFIYEALNTGVAAWQPGQTTLNSYNADTGKVVAIDQTNAQGASGNYIYQNFSSVNILSDRVVYGLAWAAYYANSGLDVGGKTNSIISVNADGSNRKDLRDITLPTATTYTSLNAVLYQPNTLYIQSSVQSQPAVYYSYQYQNNSVSQSSTITDATFGQAQQNYVTYLISPTGKSTFWSQLRDGKNTLFTGDASGNNGAQIASLSDYAPYGWYTDNYLLVQKGGSELYIMSAAGGTPFKISDYYKPSYSFYGYGGGYGGL